MIDRSSKMLLYIEPRGQREARPVVDALVRKLHAAWERRRPTDMSYRGWHTCSCGKHSTNTDYILPGGLQTNSLCLHYLVWHRSEVPAAELEKVRRLP